MQSAEHIQVEYAQKFFGVLKVVGAHASTTARVGDAAIERAGRFYGLRHDTFDIVFVRHVPGDELNTSAVSSESAVIRAMVLLASTAASLISIVRQKKKTF